MQKWSNSVRRTDRPAKPAIFRRPFFSRFGPFGVDLEKKISAKIFAQKKIYHRNTWVLYREEMKYHVIAINLKIFAEKKISKSTPNGPKREKTVAEKSPILPADQIWPFCMCNVGTQTKYRFRVKRKKNKFDVFLQSSGLEHLKK